MQNISLLEEVFTAMSQSEGVTEDESSTSKTNPTLDDNADATTAAVKLGLRSDTMRRENHKKRIRDLIDKGLSELKNSDISEDASDLNDKDELSPNAKLAKIWKSKAAEVSVLIEKINKARNMEDLKSCVELKSEIFNQHTEPNEIKTGTEQGEETEDVEQSKEQLEKVNSETNKELDYSLPKPFTASEIDQETLAKIDAHFSSLEQIEDL